jgi:hypothetical protein
MLQEQKAAIFGEIPRSCADIANPTRSALVERARQR